MIKRTTYQYDIKHTGDEMDRLEILAAFNRLANLVEDAHGAEVTVASVKTDLISVTIETVEVP